MRNILKAATLESKFPLLSAEQDCIISKDADITVAFRVELPELFTVTESNMMRYIQPGIKQSRCCLIIRSSISKTGLSRKLICRRFKRMI